MTGTTAHTFAAVPPASTAEQRIARRAEVRAARKAATDALYLIPSGRTDEECAANEVCWRELRDAYHALAASYGMPF